jgi:hypothetical protein
MHKIEYEIKLNEQERPYIHFPIEYEDKPEDKFFVLELTRYLLQNIYSRRSAEFDVQTSEAIDICIRFLGQIGDEVARIIWHQMETMGEIDMMFDKKYHIEADSLEDLNKFDKYFVYNDKLYKKQNGLKAVVGEDRIIYIFNDGNWEEFK